MAKYLETQDNIEIHYNTYVKDIKKKKQKWNITTVNKKTQKKEKYVADTMLSAAGGGSI
jgi:L-2-hydroxyglutarate oxidase LhgO